METSDAASDDGEIDAGDPPCGTGTCSAGETCAGGCKWCRCGASGWSCGTLCPPASDGGAPPSVPPCPAFAPDGSGTYCPLEGQRCAFRNACGDLDRSVCTLGDAGRTWVTTRALCTHCPPSMLSGLRDHPPCTPGFECSYDNACGGKDTLICAAEGPGWGIASTCGPTPPDAVCPPTLPTAGSSCDDWMECRYARSCPDSGAIPVDLALCDGSTWKVSALACPPRPASCPEAAPAPGSPCATTTDCRYETDCGAFVTAHCTGAAGFAVFTTPCRPTGD
jgi:hypothetical protein